MRLPNWITGLASLVVPVTTWAAMLNNAAAWWGQKRRADKSKRASDLRHHTP